MDSAASACAHCGLPLPAANSEAGLQFCCNGCRTVFELLHQSGLAGYYPLRERLETATNPGAARAEHAGERTSFVHLDDPAVLEQVAIAGRPGTAELRCTGMHCGACVWLIERLPQQVHAQARVDLGSGRLQLEWDPARTQLSDIAALLHRAGYELHTVDAQAREAEREGQRRELVRLAVAGASAGNVMLVSFALYAGALSSMEAHWTRFFEFAALLLALPAVSYAALPYYRAAWAGLRARTLHIDLPIALGVLGGFVASVIATLRGSGEVYFDSVSALVFLLLVGRHVQQRGQQWALSQTDLLQLLVPARARRVHADGRREDCAATALRVGEQVEVLAGERVPADGTLLSGRVSVDASSLTGESRPLALEPGDAVLAGTLAVEGGCCFEVGAVGSATRIGSLAANIMAATQARAPIERAVDRISRWFVAAVLTLALIGGLAWWWIDPSRVFAVVVSLLVISCPCALGLATPVALAVARAHAARRGILLASTGALEALARADTAVFDKTGTLTEGRLEVRELVVSGVERDELASWLLALERDTGHPVGQALRRWAATHVAATHVAATNVDGPARLDAVESHVGRGQAAMLDGRPLRVGSVGWLAAPEQAEFVDALARAAEAGQTPVLVELDGRIVAMLALADRVRVDAKRALARLRKLGLALAIRSGDHPAAVAALARELDIHDYAGGLSPSDKADLRSLCSRVAMIGDGVNDAPAMRAASVSVAVGGGAELALRTADVHLAEPGLDAVADLFDGARATMRVIHRNLGVSLIYNVVFASLALAGLISPLVAALLMPASSLTVVLSSVLGVQPFCPAPSTSRSTRELADGSGPSPATCVR